MKKIAFAMYNMGLGGVEKALVELLKELVRCGDWDVTLLLLQKNGELFEWIPKEVKVKVCDIPEYILLANIHDTKNALKKAIMSGNIKAFVKIGLDCIRHKNLGQQEVIRDNWQRWETEIIADQEEYDIAVDYQGMGAFTTLYVAKHMKAKTKLTWIHNDISVIPGNMDWMKKYYEYYDKVYCVSQKVLELTVDRLPFIKEKADIFYNIIPADEILQQSKEECESLKGNCKILTIGRLSPPKGYDIAILAVKKLVLMGYDIDYYIVGEGEQRAEIEELIKRLEISGNVHLLGYQSNPYKYLAQCDIYFQPSRFEGFCITLGEAKLLHKPIVTTDFAGAREQIVHEESGLIIECNEESMVQALHRLLDSSDLQKSLAAACEKANKQRNNGIDQLTALI